MNDFVLNPKLFEIKSPPGDTLLETIEAIGMSQAELALRMGRPLKTINEIIKGKVAITPETALQLEKVLGISASFWNNRERQYRESVARKEDRNTLDSKIQWLQQIPVNEMIELGWVSSFDEPIEQLEEILKFYGISSPEQWLSVSFGKYNVLEDHPSFRKSPGSVTAWLRKGEIEAQQAPSEPLYPKLLKETLASFRNLTFLPVQNFYSQLKELCSQVGIVFNIIPELSNSNIHVATRWITHERALIQVSDHYSQDDTFWFAIFHAIGHILLHGKREVFLEADGIRGQKEDEADQFATEQLIQAGTLRSFLSKAKSITKEAIQQYSSDLGVSPGIVVGWMQKEEIVGQTQFNDLKRSLVWALVEEEADHESPTDGSVEEEFSERTEAIPQQPVNLQMDVWPGLSAGARQALMAAGFQDEAGRVDERLFADWVDQQLANVESALNQGYYRDSLADLENLIAVTRVGVGRSPALEAMVKAFHLLSHIIRSSTQAQPEQDLLVLARQAIIEANRTTQELMVSEARKQYSVAATMTESTRANNLLNQW